MKQKSKITATATDSDYLRGQAQAAKYAKVSPRTISDWQRRKIIPVIKVGRKVALFLRSQIDAALAKFQIAAIG